MQFDKDKILDLLRQGVLDRLPADARAVLTGLFSDGIRGALDAAVLNNLDKLPPVLTDIVEPFLSDIDLAQVPSQIASAVSSFFNSEGPGLSFNIGGLLDGLSLGGINIGGIFDSIASGGLGGITNLLSDFGGIDLFSMIPGSGIIRTASTIFSTVLGGGDIFGSLFGTGGFGITSVLNTLGVSNTITGLMAPILGLFGFGGGRSKCPCDPSCRKTDHFVTEKGERLLEEDRCETVISNSSTSFFSSGGVPVPGASNGNLLSSAFGFIETALGSSLVPDNVLNLTGAILGISRLSNLGSQVESSQNADWPDFMNELSYSMKAIENGFKITDNNLTGVEKILRLFLDQGFFTNTEDAARDQLVIESLTTALESVSELYAMVLALDRTKRGPVIASAFPAIATKKSQAVRPLVEKLRASTVARHLKTASDFLDVALDVWNSLDPGTETDDPRAFTPGSTSNPGISEPFDLRLGNDKFTAEYFNLRKNLEFLEDSQKIQSIFDQLSLKYSDSKDSPAIDGLNDNISFGPARGAYLDILSRLAEANSGIDSINVDRLIHEQEAAQRRKANC